jgi:hypothetical protein
MSVTSPFRKTALDTIEQENKNKKYAPTFGFPVVPEV